MFTSHHSRAAAARVLSSLLLASSSSSQMVTPSHVHTFLLFWNSPADRAMIPHESGGGEGQGAGQARGATCREKVWQGRNMCIYVSTGKVHGKGEKGREKVRRVGRR